MEREGPQPVMFPQGGRTKGRREGRKEVKGDEEAGGKGDKVGEENLYLPLQSYNHIITQRTHVVLLKSVSASSADYVQAL